MNESKIVERVAKSMTGGVKWSWEIRHVDGIGIFVQIIGDVGNRYIKWTDLGKMMKELVGQVNVGLAGLVKEGLPLNISTMDLGEAEVVSEDGRVKVFANVKVQWGQLAAPVVWDDVEEAMMEVGLK